MKWVFESCFKGGLNFDGDIRKRSFLLQLQVHVQGLRQMFKKQNKASFCSSCKKKIAAAENEVGTVFIWVSKIKPKKTISTKRNFAAAEFLIWCRNKSASVELKEAECLRLLSLKELVWLFLCWAVFQKACAQQNKTKQGLNVLKKKNSALQGDP